MKKIFTIANGSKKAAIVCLAVLFSLIIKPQIGKAQTTASYVFTQSSNIYSTITGTTAIASTWDDNIVSAPIPFTYFFNGVGYTSCSINSNGYITFGATVSSPTSYNAISSNTGYAGAIAGFSRDIGSTTSPITYTTTGSSPNRIFVIQWATAMRYNGSTLITSDNINFQIRLYETSNKAEIIYGTCNATNTTALTSQVGLRGNANTDFNNRTTTSNWAATAPGGNNAATCTSSNTVMPVSGLTLTWSPPISTGVISGSPFCQGSSITIPFIASGTFNAGNTYTAQLSNNAGSFASPTIIGTLSGNATGNLSITGTIPAAAAFGTLYRIKVISSSPVFVGSDNGTNLTINVASAVSGQPTNQTTCAGTAKTFSVTASGTSPTYQWQYSPDNGVTPFVNVVNGTPPNVTYTNATTATLTVTPSAAAANGTYFYRCVVSVNGCAAPAISNSASLQVYATPTTASAGADQTICSTTTSTTLTANTPLVGAGTWSITSGLSTLLSQFSDIHNPTATFTPAVTTAGTYALV